MPYKDKQKQTEAKKTWDQKHPENARARCKKWRDSHKKELAVSQAKYYKDNPDVYLLNACRQRAKKLGIPFNITREDVIIPQNCPALGMPLERGTKGFHESSPSIDQIVPGKGYIKGNVMVVSFRANRIKSNASLDELRKVVAYLEKIS